MSDNSDASPSLLTSEGRYRLLIDSIADYAIYMLDHTGRIVSWNPGAQRFKGYQEAEILGEHFSRFYTPEDRAAGVPERALRTAAQEGRFEAEGWRVRKDGTRLWAHVVIDPVRDPEGRVIGYAKVTRDLTERHAAQAALRHTEEQFRLLVQGVSDYAIYMLDENGIVSSWNAGAQRIKGYQPEEIIGRHFSTFYTDEDRDTGFPAVALETARRIGRYEKEGWRVRKDGTRFLANVIIDAIRDPAGRLLGFAKVTRDITERFQAQKALEEARVALFQSQKLEAIGQLTGGIAHDFNNLLMAILGSLELVRKRLPEDPRISPLIDNAIKGAHRGATLTQRMLAFARRQDLRPVAVELPELVQDMSGLLRQSVGTEVAVETRFPLGLPAVLTDPNQLESALLNLAVNARDAMPHGGNIVISAREEVLAASTGGLKDGRYVCLSIADTGEGMNEVTLSRAAEPFFTTKGVGKGTGLGLPMVYGLAQQSGGQLVLKSREGEGTTAELWLPVAASERAGAQALALPQAADLQPAARPLVILAVDDDPLVLMNTAALLEDLGHTVLAAGSGEEALSIARDMAIDVVVTDHVMPGMDGLQLAHVLRQARPDLPTVLATGFAELPEDAGAGIPRLAKPFSQAELSEAIVRAAGEAAPPLLRAG